VAVINRGEIIAEARQQKSRQDQRQAHPLHYHARLTRLRQVPGVVEVREDREAVEIHSGEAQCVVRELLALDPSLSGLEISSAGLEEAFLALTNSSNAAPQELIRA